jgi:DNA-binding response OmpR family regulator
MALLARVLVVDDDAVVAGAVRDALVDFGYAVKVALGGREALTLVPAFEPDVVLLDVSMPEMSGLEVLEHLRHDHAEVSVVMMTGNQDDTTARTARSRGALDYIVKPFTLERLECVVAAALSVRRAVSR